MNSGDSGIELVDLSLTAASIAVYLPHQPWLITKLTINDDIIRATFPLCSCERKLQTSGVRFGVVDLAGWSKKQRRSRYKVRCSAQACKQFDENHMFLFYSCCVAEVV